MIVILECRKWYRGTSNERDDTIETRALIMSHWAQNLFSISKMFKINFDNYFWIQINLYKLFFIKLMISGEYYIWSECNVCQNDSKHHWYTSISLFCKNNIEIHSKMNLKYMIIFCLFFFEKLPLKSCWNTIPQKRTRDKYAHI